MIINNIESKSFLDILCCYALLIKTCTRESQLRIAVEEAIIAKYVSAQDNRNILSTCIHLLRKEGPAFEEELRNCFIRLRIYGFQITEQAGHLIAESYQAIKRFAVNMLHKLYEQEQRYPAIGRMAYMST